MTSYFARLRSSGEPATDVQHFYQVAGRLDTLAHVTEVAAEARTLAVRHGAGVEAANLAALAHDLAAVVPVAEMPAVAQRLAITIGEADRMIPQLLHGPIAAAVLEEKLGVDDKDVLNAVRYHSTLRAGASVLEKIVFLADKIAYDPKSPHGGEYVPALLAVQSLDEAVLVYLDFLLDNAWRYAWFLHPHAVAAYRELAGQSMKISLPQPARIVGVIDESPKVRTLLLDLYLEAEPGQFVMAWLPGLDEKPLSLVCAEPVTLTVARVGPFSTAMHALEVGNPIWIRGPLGQGFTLAEPQGALLLLGGGYGVAPIYFLAERALAHGCEVSMVIGARTSADVVFADRFRSLGVQVVVATDDGSLGRQGLATDAAERLLEQAGYQAIYACGPEPMLEAVASLAETHHLPAQLSYERYMRCGLGVCGSCVHQGWLVCRDGPVRYVGRGVQHVEHG